MRPPSRVGQKCFIGSSPSSVDRNHALSEAYKNALLNVIEREFPDVISISTRSSERLEGSTFSRDTAYKSENVQFNGLSEDKESPFIETSPSQQNFIATRLVCWSDDAISNEKKRQADVKKANQLAITNRIDGLLPPSAKPGPTGELEVKTTPAGASVMLAAVPVGTSNARFERVVSGNYELVVQKEGYEIESREIQIVPGRTTRVFIELKRVRSELSITSEPPGAIVYVDNKPLEQKTPTKADTVVGEDTEIRVEMDDYFSEKRIITTGFRPRTEAFILKPKESDLTILSTPSGADVDVDGAIVGKTPMSKKIEGGKHSLKLKLEGFEEVSQGIELWRSRPLTLKVKLTPANEASPLQAFSSEGTDNDATRRQKMTKRCNDEEFGYCHSAAKMWLNGDGGRADTKVAKELFDKACKWGDPYSCFHAAELSGEGPEAMWYFRQACNGRLSSACDEVSKRLNSTIENHKTARKNKKTAIKVLTGAGGLGLFIYGLSMDTKTRRDCKGKTGLYDYCTPEETDYDKLMISVLSTMIGLVAFSFSFAL